MKPAWNVCVVSHRPPLPAVPDLVNALIFADEVTWLPTELPSITAFAWLVKDNKDVVPTTDDGVDVKIRIQEYLDVMGELSKLPVPVYTSPAWADPMAYITVRPPAGNELGLARAKALLEPGVDGTLPPAKPDEEQQLRAVFDAFCATLDNLNRLNLPDADPVVIEHMQRAHGCVIEDESPYALRPIERWRAHHGAQTLITALSRILLPDVSTLPFAEAIEMRQKAAPELEPLRAEMLRLSELLRHHVASNPSPSELALEAENVIATRVEPLLREASRNMEELMKSRWRCFWRGVLKTLGFIGLGFLDPHFAKKGVEEAVKLASEHLADSDIQPPSAAARLVLQLRGAPR